MRISTLLGLCLGVFGLLTADADEYDQFFAEEQAAIRSAVSEIAPTLVRIQTLGGLESSQGILASRGPTTGILISKDGYLLSSAFHFIQEPSSILVTLADGEQHGAKLVARDHARQLVLLKIETDQQLPVPIIVSRDEMHVGQRTIALGHAFDGDWPNLSIGILSARDRVWGRAVQTDAKVSPNNYGGPLIDLEGRMLGLLVPLSPQSNSEVAGVEWYDSGIGFAAYLADLEEHWETLKSGTDLRPGLMGIALKGKSIYTSPAIVAAVRVESPAAKAGVQVDDEIIAVDDRSVSLQTHLKRALGVRYAGETVTLTLRRGAQTVKVDLKLADRIDPYTTPLLGVLPRRERLAETDDPPPGRTGIDVRYVYPDSPAAEVGIVAGSRLLGIDDQSLDSVSRWHTALAKYQAGDRLTVRWQSGNGERHQSTIQLAEPPTTVPLKLPPATPSPDRQAVGAKDLPIESANSEWLEIRVPALPNDCLALVPGGLPRQEESDATDEGSNASALEPHGVLVLFASPGPVEKQSLRSVWGKLCHQHQLILLVPQSRDATRWQRDELEFGRKALDILGKQFPIDPHRIAIMGQRAGGAMGLHFTLANRDVVRGLALVDAQLPRQIPTPENRPLERLGFFLLSPTSGPKSQPAKRLAEFLRKQKFPVTQSSLEGSSELTTSQRAEWIRWVDTLDRI